MSKLNRIHIVAMIIIAILYVANQVATHEPTVTPMTEQKKDAAFEEALEFHGNPKDVSLVPFDFNINPFIDNPSFGLIIDPNACVDTYLLEDVSCDDKAAIVAYRKALNDIEVRRLREKIKQREIENLFCEFGIQEV